MTDVPRVLPSREGGRERREELTLVRSRSAAIIQTDTEGRREGRGRLKLLGDFGWVCLGVDEGVGGSGRRVVVGREREGEREKKRKNERSFQR